MQQKLLIILFVLTALPATLLSRQYDKDSLLHVLHTTVLPSDKIEILNLLADEYAAKDLAQSENYANQALFLAQSINDDHGEAIAQFHLARVELEKNNSDRAFQLLKMAKIGLGSQPGSEWMGRIDHRLAVEYKRRLEFKNALSLLYDALDIFTNLNDEQEIAEIYNTIGGVYYDQANYDKAFEYYQNSFSIYSELNNERGMAALYNNIGEIYRLSGKPEAAMNLYKKAQIINIHLNRRHHLAVNYNNIGNIYLALNNIDSASYYFELSLNIGESIDEPQLISSASISLGNLFLQKNQYAKALNYFNRGYEVASRQNNIINLRDAALGMSKIYEQKKNFEQAYNFHIQYKTLSDSITNVQNQEKITRIEMQYIYEREQKIKEVRKQKTQFKNFLIAASLFIILIILVLIYGRQKIKIKHSHYAAQNLQLEKSRLEEEIDFKNRELTTKVMYMVHKNELINFITQKLVRAKNNFDVKNKSQIQEIIVGLQSGIDKDIWKEFESRFKEVHKNFYKRLMELHPNLTENEKKLCAFLRLNMTTKEIAAIMHQNPNSIEVARTRMRKKMNLNNKEINLNNYLAGL
ncbi:MAG: tetratricopeptide repeat protein [Bacteroidetes bacterium]|nr:tetratricopeptide repeat protein [Bacteroidota bacterium]